MKPRQVSSTIYSRSGSQYHIFVSSSNLLLKVLLNQFLETNNE